MEQRLMERKPSVHTETFKSPEEELAFLREKVREKETEVESAGNRAEYARIAKREVVEYAGAPTARVLNETYAMPEHEVLRTVLQLEPEEHDVQMDGLLRVVAERGIKNALSVVEKMKNPHLEDDLHRMLVRYMAEGLPLKGKPPPERIQRALHLALFEVRPEAAHAGDDDSQKKLGDVLASSEQLYAGLLSMAGEHGSFSLEIAVPEGL